MKRAALIGALALALTPCAASAAPLSPSASYAYAVASQHMGEPANCTSIDKGVIPDGPEGFAAVSSPALAEPAPCYIYIARWLALPRSFGNACRTFYNILATMQGLEQTFTRMPQACSSRILFLLNHPHYLRRYQDGL